MKCSDLPIALGHGLVEVGDLCVAPTTAKHLETGDRLAKKMPQ